ncbi:hypothetical protein BOC58_12890 [Burkholderia pseudomallei]|nr:hypothetical protein BOC57_24735 [Burkholderia pseudomallei]ARL93748.1 hypothetical protein BOC58_12890 [Burkholderia pseudomallei]
MPVRRAARRNARRRLRHATRMPRRARPPAHATGAAFRTSRRPRSPRSAALATLRTASSDAPGAAARPAFRLDRSDARGRFPSRPRVP